MPFGAILQAKLVETQDLAQHQEKRRPQKIAFLGKQGPQAVAAPFHLAVVQRQGEAHVAIVGLDAEMGKQGCQVWVIQFVVDDKSGIYGNGRAVIVDVDRRGVASGAFFGLVECHVVQIPQSPCSRGAGNAGANDGHFQAFRPAGDGKGLQVNVHATSLIC